MPPSVLCLGKWPSFCMHSGKASSAVGVPASNSSGPQSSSSSSTILAGNNSSNNGGWFRCLHQLSPSYSLGLFFILCVAFIWAASSVLVQHLYSHASVKSPFLITYIGGSLFSILLLLPNSKVQKAEYYSTPNSSMDLGSAANNKIDNSTTKNKHSMKRSEKDFKEGTTVLDYDSDNDPDGTAAMVTSLLKETSEKLLHLGGVVVGGGGGSGNNDNMSEEEKKDDSMAVTINTSSSMSTVNGVNNGGIPKPPMSGNSVVSIGQLSPSSGAGVNVGTLLINHHKQQLPWTRAQHFKAALQLSPIWFFANWSCFASLEFTSIHSNTVLVSTSAVWSFLLDLYFGGETFGWYKMSGVMLGVMGSILTGFSDGAAHSSSSDGAVQGILDEEGALSDLSSAASVAHANGQWGDFLGIIAAVGFGAYAVRIHSLCPADESRYSMLLVLGYLGLLNFILFAPVACYLFLSGSSVVLQDLTPTVFFWICINGLFDHVLSDYLWLRSVLLTSPTVATVGLGLTIPLAFACDVLLGHPNVLTFHSILGAMCVLSGFVLVNIGSSDHYYHHDISTLKASVPSGKVEAIGLLSAAGAAIARNNSSGRLDDEIYDDEESCKNTNNTNKTRNVTVELRPAPTSRNFKGLKDMAMSIRK